MTLGSGCGSGSGTNLRASYSPSLWLCPKTQGGAGKITVITSIYSALGSCQPSSEHLKCINSWGPHHPQSWWYDYRSFQLKRQVKKLAQGIVINKGQSQDLDSNGSIPGPSLLSSSTSQENARVSLDSESRPEPTTHG